MDFSLVLQPLFSALWYLIPLFLIGGRVYRHKESTGTAVKNRSGAGTEST